MDSQKSVPAISHLRRDSKCSDKHVVCQLLSASSRRLSFDDAEWSTQRAHESNGTSQGVGGRADYMIRSKVNGADP